MLFERETELATANAVVRSAEAGQGSLLVVTGPPGAGRTALLGALPTGDERGRWVLRADGALLERGYPLGVLRQLCQPLLAGAKESELARYFGGVAEPVRRMLAAPTWTEAGGPSRETVLRGLHALVTQLAEDRPVWILVDDLQWADEFSLRALGYLAKRLDGVRALMACAISDSGFAGVTARRATGGQTADPLWLRDIVTSAAHTLQPAPLSAAAVRAVLIDELGVGCDPEFAEACHLVTGGNPAAVMTVAEGLRGQGFRFTAEEAGRAAEASQLLLVERRLFGLRTQPAEVRELAQAMVVLDTEAGTGAPIADTTGQPELLAELAELDEIEYKAAVQALDRLGILAPGDVPRFVHPSVRRALEAVIPLADREKLHHRAAMLLHTAGRPAEQVAAQLLALTSAVDAWQVDVLRSAASAALDRRAGEDAARYLRCALLGCPPGSPRRPRLLVDLAAAERGFDLGASVSHLSQALLELDSPDERVTAVLRIPPALARTRTHLADLIRSVAAEAELRPQTGRAGRERALRLEARVRALGLQHAGQLDSSVARLRELGGDLPLSTSAGRELITVLTFAATATRSLSAREVTALCAQVLEREPASPDHAYDSTSMLVYSGVTADCAEDMLPWLEEGWAAARRRPYAGEQASAAVHLAAALTATGRLSRAVELAGLALDRAGESWPEVVAVAAQVKATVALATQDVEMARSVLEAGRVAREPRDVITHRMLRGMIDAVEGDLPAALDRFLDCGKQLARWGWRNPALYPWRPWAAALFQQQGDVGSAVVLAEAELDAAKAWGAPTPHGRALRLLGMLTGGEQGIELLRESLAVLEDAGDRLEPARTGVVLARRLRGIGSTAEAARVRAVADAIAAERGCAWLDGNEEAELNGPSLSLLLPGRAGLSKAEDSVVDLVVRGWTNQRIADELGVTRRAVEKNLTSTYRKLGVAGRTELVAKLTMQA